MDQSNSKLQNVVYIDCAYTEHFNVSITCARLVVSESGYYCHQNHKDSTVNTWCQLMQYLTSYSYSCII